MALPRKLWKKIFIISNRSEKGLFDLPQYVIQPRYTNPPFIDSYLSMKGKVWKLTESGNRDVRVAKNQNLAFLLNSVIITTVSYSTYTYAGGSFDT